MRGFAEQHLANGARTKAVVAGDFTGFTFAYGEDLTYWRWWYLRKCPIAVLISYNCAIGAMHQEDRAIEEIVASLKARVSGLL